jgi:hypothetical protein
LHVSGVEPVSEFLEDLAGPLRAQGSLKPPSGK